MDPSFKHTNDNNNKKNKKPTTIKQQQNEEKKQKQQGNSKETKTLNNYKVISKKTKTNSAKLSFSHEPSEMPSCK